MNDIRDLFPGKMRERTFQLKAKRDAGAVWHEPQFVECKQCGRRAARTLWTKSLFVCPNCGYHMPIGGYYRLSLVLDHGSFRELDADLPPQDVLSFPDYSEKLAAAQNKTGLREAAVTATGRIGGVACVAAVLDSRFFMGSMSTAVGERVTRAIEYAAAKKLPLVIFYLSILHVVPYKTFRSQWRYVYVALMLLSAVVTPDASPITMLLMFAALIALYEVALAVARYIIIARDGKAALKWSRADYEQHALDND